MDTVRDQFRKIEVSLVAGAHKASGTKHSTTTGKLREKLIHEFLRPHLPLDLGIKSGIIIDSLGRRSSQQDCVITDSHLPLVDVGDETEAILLAEGVIATIEVKSYLNKGELLKALDSSKKTKALKRSGTQIYAKNGVEVVLPKTYTVPTYVIAYDGDSLESLSQNIRDYAYDEGTSDCIPEAICILGKGLITKTSARPIITSTKVTLPSAAGDTELKGVKLKNDALFAFYKRIFDDVIPLRMRHFDIDDYYISNELS